MGNNNFFPWRGALTAIACLLAATFSQASELSDLKSQLNKTQAALLIARAEARKGIQADSSFVAAKKHFADADAEVKTATFGNDSKKINAALANRSMAAVELAKTTERLVSEDPTVKKLLSQISEVSTQIVALEKPLTRKNDRALSVLPENECRRIVTEYLKNSVNDASKLEIVQIGTPAAMVDSCYWAGGHTADDERMKAMGIAAVGFWEQIEQPGTAVTVRFRSTNSIGALVLQDRVFCIGGNIEVVKAVPYKDFSIKKPGEHEDPFTKAFMDMAK